MGAPVRLRHLGSFRLCLFDPCGQEGEPERISSRRAFGLGVHGAVGPLIAMAAGDGCRDLISGTLESWPSHLRGCTKNACSAVWRVRREQHPSPRACSCPLNARIPRRAQVGPCSACRERFASHSASRPTRDTPDAPWLDFLTSCFLCLIFAPAFRGRPFSGNFV
ncbi:hypothetical protein L1887_51919 [Cichorium endivia]|nr:hypothetical protein L1887_51919 [Cichorium endivia]